MRCNIKALGVIGLFLAGAVPASAEEPVFEKSFQDKQLKPLNAAKIVGMRFDHETLLLSDESKASVYRLDPVTGKVTTLVLDKQGKNPDEPGELALFDNGRIAASMADDGMIDVLSPEGKVLRRFGGSGDQEGELGRPESVAVSSSRLYVAEASNKRVSVFTQEGLFLFALGRSAKQDDSLIAPVQIGVDAGENIYVLDRGKGGRLFIYEPQGKLSKKIEKGVFKGVFGGKPDLKAMYVTPSGLLFLADQRSGRIALLDPKTEKAHYLLGSNGQGRGQFRNVRALALNGQQLAVADSSNRKIEIFHVPADAYQTKAEVPYLTSVKAKSGLQAPCAMFEHYRNGGFICLDQRHDQATIVDAAGKPVVRLDAKLRNPIDAAYDDEQVLVLDEQSIKVFGHDGVFKFEIGRRGRRDGEFSHPSAVTIADNIYIADTGNSRVQIFSRNGVFKRELTTPKGQKPGMDEPRSVAVDHEGRIYAGDSEAGYIWLFSSEGKYIGALGMPEDTPLAFEEIRDMVTGPDDRIYVLAETEINPAAIFVYHGRQREMRFAAPRSLLPIKADEARRIALKPGSVPALSVLSPKTGKYVDFTVLHVPPAPQQLQVEGGIDQVALYWEGKVVQGGGEYRVYAASQADGPFELMAASAQPKLTLDRHKMDGKSYFAVTIKDENGLEGPRSKTVHDAFFKAYEAFRQQDYASAVSILGKALEKNPRHAPALEYMGRALMQQEKTGEAVRYFQRLRAVHGYETLGYNLQAGALLKNRQWLEAKNVIDAATAEDVADAQTYAICTQTRIQLGDVLGSIGCAEKSAELEPTRSRWYLQLASLYEQLGADKKSQASMQKAVQLAGDNAESWFELAKVYNTSGKTDDAMSCYERVLQIEPDHLQATLELARLKLGKGQADEVRRMAIDMSSDEAKAPLANYLMGELALRDGKTEQALIYLAKAGESKMTGSLAWEALAKAYADTGNARRRVQALQKAVQFEPNDIDLRKSLAAACGETGDDPCVRENLQYALAYAPKDFDMQLSLANSLLRSEKYAEALKHATAAVALQPKNTEAMKAEAEANRLLGNVAKALAILEKVKKYEPNSQEVYLLVAHAYMDNRLFDQAQNEIEQAIALKPAVAAPYAQLGEVFMARQMFDQAIDAFKKATQRGDAPAYQQRLNYAYIQKKKVESFGGKGAALALENFKPRHIFAATYKRYTEEPVATVELSNASGIAYDNVKVSLHIKSFMDFPSSRMIDSIKPGEKIEIPLYASFSNNILNIDEDTGVQSEITASYYSMGKPVTAQLTQPMTIYGKNAMLWSNSAMVASFITPKDDALSVFVRQIINRYQHEVGPLNKNLVKAMTVFQVLSAHGTRYQSDPNSPYSQMQSTQVDTVQFPRETLRLRSGDCDDLSVLLASALENLGIETALLDVPAHLLMMFNTGYGEAEADKLSLNHDLLVIRDGMVWIPVEATLIGASFSEAWVEGARKYRKYTASGELKVISTHKSWQAYAPVTLPPAKFELPLPKKAAVQKALDREWSILATKAMERLAAPYTAALAADPANNQARMQLAIIYARNGLYDLAEQEMSHILAKSDKKAELQNNLGNVYFLSGDMEKAVAAYAEAIKLDSHRSEYQVNMAMAYYKMGNIRKATDLYRKVATEDKNAAKRYSHFAALLSR